MLWLWGKENVPDKWIKRFRTLATNTKPKTAKAWATRLEPVQSHARPRR